MENYQMASLDVHNVNNISFQVSPMNNIENQTGIEQNYEQYSFESCFNNSFQNNDDVNPNLTTLKSEFDEINPENLQSATFAQQTNLLNTNEFRQSEIEEKFNREHIILESNQIKVKRHDSSLDFGCFVPINQNDKITLTNHGETKLDDIKMSTMNPPKIQKRVNYLNHKFVISETEDISLDKLLSAPGKDHLNTNFLELKSKLQKSKSPNTFYRTPKQGESILKSTVVQEIHGKKVFCVENNKMKPILSPTVSSGIFRSHNRIKRSKIEETSGPESPSNILISKSIQSKIIPKSQIENITSTKISNEKPATVTSQNSETSVNNRNYNRQFIKIPLSVLPVLKKASANNEINGLGNNLKSKLSSNNLVLNIVNMVANNPEITQKTEIIHKQFPVEGANRVETSENIDLVNSNKTSSGNVAIQDDRKSMVYHNRETNTKIIYRIINPEDVNLRKEDSIQIDKTIKLKKSNFVHRNRPGRPKGVQRKRTESITNPDQSLLLTQPTARTRAGRLSRPPRHVQNYFKVTGKFTESINDNQVANGQEKSVENNFNIDNEENIRINHPELQVVKRERKIPSQYKCKKCNKIYLGYNRMARHLESFPDHGDLSELFQMKVKNLQTYDDTLFQYLIKKIRKIPRENRARQFFDEISNLTRRIQLLVPKLITENTECPFEYIDHEMMKVLNIPTGKYFIDMEALNNDLNLEMPPLHTTDTLDFDVLTDPNHHYHTIHHNLPQTVDQTIRDHQIDQNIIQQHNSNQDHHHHHHAINDNHPHTTIEYNLLPDSNDADKNLSDDSFLQSVDEFVKERWKNIAEEELTQLHHHASVSSVVPNFISHDTHMKDLHHHHHPPILDLSLEYLLN